MVSRSRQLWRFVVGEIEEDMAGKAGLESDGSLLNSRLLLGCERWTSPISADDLTAQMGELG